MKWGNKMALFRKNKNKEAEKPTVKNDDALKEDISKAYDELTSGASEGNDGGKESAPNRSNAASGQGNFESEILKIKIREFKEKKTQQSLADVINLLPKRTFLLPSVSNMKEPFENKDGKLTLKQGATLNPALLTGNDKKIFLPIFTDEQSMKQKSPSGIVLKFTMEQCVSIVYNKNNPVWALAINPFTENMIIGEDILRQVFHERKKEK